MKAGKRVLDIDRLSSGDSGLKEAILSLPDELLPLLSFSLPWQSIESVTVDPDGFSSRTTPGDKEDLNVVRSLLQGECWKQAVENPQINTSVRGLTGRINGFGFSITSPIKEIQQFLDEIMLDPRNRLWLFLPKFTARSIIEGELFLLFTCHEDGFIEIDFIEPSSVSEGPTNGILFHPRKPTMPLIYCIKNGYGVEEHIPSIFLARYPSMINDLKKPTDISLVPGWQDSVGAYFKPERLNGSRSKSSIFRKLGGFYRFIISWDRSFLTQRNVSHIRTTIKWLNHYENLKLYEIDHKKSAGAYLWVVKIEDVKTFKLWLALSDDERAKTAIMAKKTPGSTLVLPPGMTIEALNPKLPNISEGDTDIFHMITSGLDQPEDVVSGQSKGTFASVKASRGPMADRTSDEVEAYEKFMRYEFFGSLFFLRSQISNFPETFPVREAVDFKKETRKVEVPIPVMGKAGGFIVDDDFQLLKPHDGIFAEDPKKSGSQPKKSDSKSTGKPQEPAKPVPIPTKMVDQEVIVPIFEEIQKKPYDLLEFSFPTSEVENLPDRAGALLGVKHGSIKDVLGIPASEIAKKMGFGNYYRLRLKNATEDDQFPSLISNVDDEAFQEKTQSEPSPSKIGRKIPK